MGYRIPIIKDTSIVKGTSISLQDFYAPFIESTYSEYLKQRVVVNRYRYYDGEYLYIPIYDLQRLLDYLNGKCDVKIINIPPPEGMDVEIPLRGGVAPRDQNQADAVDYLVNAEQPVRSLALPTGKGKTASVLLAGSQIKKRMLIMMTSLIDQWAEAIEKFTLLDLEKDVYILQGKASVYTLINEIDKTIFPKIILANIPTLQAFLKDSDLEDTRIFNNLCTTLNVGVRVIDEVHMRFKTNLMMDLRFNTKITIPVTATFGRTNPVMDAIFQRHYPRENRFGEELKNKHIEIQAYGYNLDTTDMPNNKFKTHMGYSQNLFEKYLLKKKPLFRKICTNVYWPILNSVYFNIHHPKEKLLVLFNTIDMRDTIARILQQLHPTYKVECYTTGMVLSDTNDLDIIVSTPKKAGTGTDIKNLRSMFVGVSTSSSIDNEQQLGRLRDLKNGVTPIFAYSYCFNIPSQLRHHNVRKQIFKPICKSIMEFRI